MQKQLWRKRKSYIHLPLITYKGSYELINDEEIGKLQVLQNIQ